HPGLPPCGARSRSPRRPGGLGPLRRRVVRRAVLAASERSRPRLRTPLGHRAGPASNAAAAGPPRLDLEPPSLIITPLRFCEASEPRPDSALDGNCIAIILCNTKLIVVQTICR